MNIRTLIMLLMTITTTIQQQSSPIPNVTVAFSFGGIIYQTNFKGEPIQITDGSTYDILPTWSADGQQLTYLSASYEDISRASHLMVMNAATHKAKQVTSLDLTSETNLAWSPDGKHMAVTLGALYVIDLDTGKTHQLSVDNISAQYPSWSSDSQQIAFSSDGDIYVTTADGHDTQKLTLTQSGQFNYQPRWSPDNKYVLFFLNQATQVSMKIFDLVTKETREVFSLSSTGQNEIIEPKWSSDGSKIAFTVFGDPSSTLAIVDYADVYVMDSDGTMLHRITEHGADYIVEWTDNKRILYQSREPDAGGADVIIFAVNIEDDTTSLLSNDTLKQMCAYGECKYMSNRPPLPTS